MSALLRALMAQQAGGDKPNLAIVTDSTVSIDALAGRKFTATGITAKALTKGKTYHVEFDVEVTVQESSAEYGQISLGNYIPWGSGVALLNSNVIGLSTFKSHVDKTLTLIGNTRENDSGIIAWGQQDKKATLHIFNTVITEV